MAIPVDVAKAATTKAGIKRFFLGGGITAFWVGNIRCRFKTKVTE
jgi:hypothetical protein